MQERFKSQGEKSSALGTKAVERQNAVATEYGKAIDDFLAGPEHIFSILESALPEVHRIRKEYPDAVVLPAGHWPAVYVIQGMTGKQGAYHVAKALDYGTRVVAGVTPGKGGQNVRGVPVLASQTRAVPSSEAVTTRWPSGLKRTKRTSASCRSGWPMRSPVWPFQRRAVLSNEVVARTRPSGLN